MKPQEHFVDDPTQVAIAQRLARLASLPVDTHRLDRALRGRIPALPRPAWRRSLKPLAGIAAGFLLIALVSWALLSGGQVQASPAFMAEMHRDIVSGKIATMKADSIEQANQTLATLGSDLPKLPEPPANHTMACCMRNVGDKKVACVLLKESGAPVTMVVAENGALAPLTGSTVVRGGQTYYLQVVDDLNMVMLERENRRICLISALPTENLLDLAGQIKF